MKRQFTSGRRGAFYATGEEVLAPKAQECMLLSYHYLITRFNRWGGETVRQ